MATACSLLLLLAVLSSQVQRSASVPSVTLYNMGDVDISSCPITYYGQKSTVLHVAFRGPATALCFKRGGAQPADDCVLVESRVNANKMSVKIKPERKNPGSSLHRELTSIKSTSDCNVLVEISAQHVSIMEISVFSFAQQAALEVRTKAKAYAAPAVRVNVTVGGEALGWWTFTAAEAKDRVYVDLSGCRHAGSALSPGSTRPDPASCSTAACSQTAVLSTSSTCKASEVCKGDNKCQAAALVCTVTGSTVVDFFNRVHQVQDRCAYSLVKPQKNLDFDVVGVFRERRRRDVTFLDHVIIWLRQAKKKIVLEQGGEVRVDEDMLTVTSTAQTVHGVELTKDQTGVTAKITAAKATIFFDGNTAHVSGNDMEVKGLCGTSTDPKKTTSLTVMKSSTFSDASCANQHSDAPDNTINCTRATERCELLKKAPFTDCHGLVDPDAFITACTNVLCKYPTVDGLRCQFLEAYARACSLKTVSLQKWRSNLGCSAIPQAFCQDKHCSIHEFCADHLGRRRCLCRAGFAAKYKAEDSLGGPTVCSEKSASLALVGCLLEERGIDYSALHLNDPKCKGVMDLKSHMVTFSFQSSSCGSKVTTENNQVIYKNSIKKTTSGGGGGVVTRKDQFVVDFSCVYTEPDVKSLGFKIKQSSVVQQVVAGAWNYTLMMNAYTDAGRQQLVEASTDVRINQRIWVELKTEGLDGGVILLVTDSCWATAEPPPESALRYDLVINGCPNAADGTVQTEGNGLGTSNSFSFNMFEFAGKKSDIYLHCRLELCLKPSLSCAPKCSGGSRRRRSTRFSDMDAALITMTMTK